jgi:luciferase family oxidoreductase group 1
MNIPLSILDVVPIGADGSAAEAVRRSVDLARLAEEAGFDRIWYAEHHSMPSIGSSAPEILIAHAAAATKRIQVGSGGMMLPNHVPLKLAESFHTLEALYPGRINLGLGRAPGTDQNTLRALRAFDAQHFPAQIAELRAFSERSFPEDHAFSRIQVVPDDVELPPIWILGSSGASARLAGSLGVGYGFAGHFSPTSPLPAFEAYRESFQPSTRFAMPHAILAISVVCAETDGRARHLATSMELGWVRLQKGKLGPIPSPEEALAHEYSLDEQLIVERYRSMNIVGDPASVRRQIEQKVAETGADEVMISTIIYDHEERLRSHQLVAEAFR